MVAMAVGPVNVLIFIMKNALLIKKVSQKSELNPGQFSSRTVQRQQAGLARSHGIGKPVLDHPPNARTMTTVTILAKVQYTVFTCASNQNLDVATSSPHDRRMNVARSL
jgi:hypothetical protein